MDATDKINVIIQDALALTQYHINDLRRQVEVLFPNLHPASQQDPGHVPVRTYSNHLTPSKENYTVVNLLKERFGNIQSLTTTTKIRIIYQKSRNQQWC